MALKLLLNGGPLDGETHEVAGRFPDIIEKPWKHSPSMHIYELCRNALTGRYFYRHAKSYRPATQECEGH